MITDRSTVRREREQKRRIIQTFQTRLTVQALYFDGKKDTTVTIKKSGDGTHVVKEERITLDAEPCVNYIDHFTPNSGKGIGNFEGID